MTPKILERPGFLTDYVRLNLMTHWEILCGGVSIVFFPGPFYIQVFEIWGFPKITILVTFSLW